MSTRTKVLLLNACVSVIILGIGYNLGGRLGLFAGLILAIAFIAFFFLQGENASTQFYNAEKIAGQDPWQLLPLIQNVALAEKMTIPDVYIFSHPGIHCFSYWPLISAPRICFSDSALDQLDAEELRLLIIHQILLLKKTDSPRFLFVQRMAQSIVALARMLDHLIPFKLIYPHKVVLFERLFSFFAEGAIDLVYNERLYIKLDLLTAQRTQNREALGDLIWRINGLNQTQPIQLLSCSKHLFFVNPRLRQGKFRKRIQKLVGYYPV